MLWCGADLYRTPSEFAVQWLPPGFADLPVPVRVSLRKAMLVCPGIATLAVRIRVALNEGLYEKHAESKEGESAGRA